METGPGDHWEAAVTVRDTGHKHLAMAGGSHREQTGMVGFARYVQQKKKKKNDRLGEC